VNYNSIILPAAKQDIKEAAEWYNDKGKGLGKRFIVEVRVKVKFIKQNPNASAIRYDNIRTTVLPIFPFMIHYYIDEVQKNVIIVSVLHTSRNPDIRAERE